MAVYNGQSWMFWTSNNKKMLNSQENSRPNLDARASGISQVSRLTSEMSNQELDEGEEDEEDRSGVHCKHCGSEEFKIKFIGGEKVLACGACERSVDAGVKKKKEENQNAYSRFYT
jgi:hypothetical protein